MRIVLLILACFGSSTWAYSEGSFIFDPHVAIGINSVQGTHYTGGLDLGYAWTEQLAFGVHGYYSAGEHPSDDREMGAGPFVGYVQPITSFLFAHLREEMNYVDQYQPIKVNNEVTGHTHEMGTVSSSFASLHISFPRNFGFSFGYNLVLGLSNRALDEGRSGIFLGFSIGI